MTGGGSCGGVNTSLHLLLITLDYWSTLLPEDFNVEVESVYHAESEQTFTIRGNSKIARSVCCSRHKFLSISIQLLEASDGRRLLPLAKDFSRY